MISFNKKIFFKKISQHTYVQALAKLVWARLD